MADPMTPERLAEIRERAEVLTRAIDAEFTKEHDAPYEHGIEYYLGAAVQVTRAVPALLAEVERLRAELDAFKPQPMSQLCRDGKHNGVGDWKCLGCHCLCHNRDTEVEQLQRSRDGWEADAGTYLDNATYWRARANAAEAERDRLRSDVAAWRDSYERLSRQVLRRHHAWQSARRGRKQARAELDDLAAQNAKTEDNFRDFAEDALAVQRERDRLAEQVQRTEQAVHAFFADADQRGVHLDGMTVTELCDAVMAAIRALGGTEASR